MPRPVNNLQITGTLTSDPKCLVITKGEKPIRLATWTLAFDWWNGHRLNPAWYFNCVSFGYAAIAAEKFLKKGQRIIITESYIQQDKYTSKSGINMNTVKIVVNDFVLVAYNKETAGETIEAVAEQLEDVDEVPY